MNWTLLNLKPVVSPVIPLKNKRLVERLGYQFVRAELLEQALTHRSYGSHNNERLEFLGDSILNFSVAHALFERFPAAKEGDLSRLRAALVKGDTLAEIAREFDLGDFLKLGEGELKSGGFRRASILADALEAIIGAIFLDAGFEVARNVLMAWFQVRLAALSLSHDEKDPKTLLQEFLQSRKQPLPQYDVVKVEGESHAQMFTVSCRVQALSSATLGVAPSRRAAEKEAAEKMLALILP